MGRGAAFSIRELQCLKPTLVLKITPNQILIFSTVEALIGTAELRRPIVVLFICKLLQEGNAVLAEAPSHGWAVITPMGCALTKTAEKGLVSLFFTSGTVSDVHCALQTYLISFLIIPLLSLLSSLIPLMHFS